MARNEALITPTVIRWAREQAKYSIEEAAKKIKRTPEEILSWEEGASMPSISQARKASEIYKRPLAVFYMPEPPSEFLTLRDFRKLPLTENRDYGPDLALLIRTTVYRQNWVREFFEEENINQMDFVGSSNLNDSPKEIAKDILRVLDISSSDQKKCKSRSDALLYWIKKAERVGIFIFRQSGISIIEARGFIICDDIVPFIYINSADSKAGQIFTLAHELAHLWLNISGVSNFEEFGESYNSETGQIETFCNKIAAQLILDEDEFDYEWESLEYISVIEEKIQEISSIFHISEEVVARRLLERNIISRNKYVELREYYQTRWQELNELERKRMKESDSGPGYFRTTVVKNGYSFTQTVVSAFLGGQISGRDASSLLNAKVNNLKRLGETAGL